MILGRLAWEMQRLLDNTSRDATRTHLYAGKLSRNWAAVARGAEDVFERRRTEDGIDSAVFVAIDNSGSMSSCIRQVRDAVMMFSEALKRCPGVATMIAGFDNGVTTRGGDDMTGERVYVDRAKWCVFKTWQAGFAGLKDKLDYHCRDKGGTPEVAALRDALMVVSRRPEQRKIILWIGDGDGYDADAIHALQARYSEVTVVAVGIDVDLSAYFKHNVNVQNASDLARASFATVAKAIAA